MKKKKIKIVEVGARDGLQNEALELDVKTRWEFIKKLSSVGLEHIEVGAFVSSKWVPQMTSSDVLVKRALKSKWARDIQYTALVPNLKGMELALSTDIKEVAIFGACSESFSKKNINCSITEGFKRFEQVIQLAHKNKIKVRAYLSTAFGCPYEGKIKESQVVKLSKKMIEMGVYEISIGDTIGVATPKQIRSLIPKLLKVVPSKKLAMHFHDTRGTALANVLASLDLGLHIFDSSLGGLGGCPYAKGASGNLGTEDLVYMLEGMGYKTGVDLKALIKIKNWIEDKVQHPLPSHVGRSGLPLPGTL